MPCTLTSEQRNALIEALTFTDLKAGKGSHKQQAAYQELEWRRCSPKHSGLDGYEYWRTHYGFIILKSGEIVPWTEPYPMQVSAAREWGQGFSTMEVKARQLGETTNATHYALHDCMFNEAVVWNFFGADDDASKDMMRRLDATLDRLPKWMLDRSRMTAGAKSADDIKRKDKQEAATILTFGLSKIRVFTGSVKKAQGLTGKTLWDDAGKHTDPQRKWQLLYPTIDDPDPNNRGQVIIIFNGNGEDFLYHLYQQSKKSEVSLVPHFYSWRDDPRRLWMADPNGEGPTCDLATKKERWPWYEHAKAQYLIEKPEADIFEFKAQYPDTEEEAFYISGNSRFDLTKLQGYNLTLQKMPPAHVGYIETDGDSYKLHKSGRVGHLRVYEYPVEGEQYILGVDPAGGHADSDYSVIQVCRLVQHSPPDLEGLIEKFSWRTPPTIDGVASFEFQPTPAVLEQVAVYQAKAEPYFVSLQARRLGEWYNDALMVIEANNHGHSVIENVKHEYHNLYKEERKEKTTDEETERIGFWSGQYSKTPMIDALAEWLDKGWLFMRDSASIKELSTYGLHVSQSGNTVRLGAPKGMNDDLVTGLGLCVAGAKSLLIVRSANPVRRYQPWEI